MKKLLLIVLVLCAGFSFAQESTYSKEGNLVAVTHYYEDGSVKETGFYKDQKLHGEWVKFNEEGIKITRAHYDNGEKVGKWMFLNDGVLTEVDYQNNEIANVYTWNSENNVVIN